MSIKSKVYKVSSIVGSEETMIFASSNINEAIESARAYLDYRPSAAELSALKNFFKQRPYQKYTFSANGKTVTMELIRK